MSGQAGPGCCRFRWPSEQKLISLPPFPQRKGEEIAGEAGANNVIEYTHEDFEDEVKRVTVGRGVQAVYDSVREKANARLVSTVAVMGEPNCI